METIVATVFPSLQGLRVSNQFPPLEYGHINTTRRLSVFEVLWNYSMCLNFHLSCSTNHNRINQERMQIVCSR
ncbi:hypothetical protein L917_04586 [Phytophthora nicotianae]|uniref:Uncharacterized protein n=1 Tax=Phytophthora nicotianae TaxID=4792 RepID=W2LLH1_PHYNI|nr:hypothetical protein L917_04586 [Phytophthora nicotianae]